MAPPSRSQAVQAGASGEAKPASSQPARSVSSITSQGAPGRSSKRACSISWRATTASSAARSRRASSAPSMRTASDR